MSGPAYARLIDPRFGVIRRLQRHARPPVSGVPADYIEYVAEVADTRRFAPWQGDRIALGSSFGDEERARLAAIGEAVERYCGNAIPNALCRASYDELRAAGRRAIDPERLIGYSARQYASRGFPFMPLDRDLSIHWVEGRDLLTGEPTLAPAARAYLNYPYARLAEPQTVGLIYAGIAAGPSREEAERAALEELFERDAATIWWLSGSPMPGIDLASAPAVGAALLDPRADGTIRYHLVQLCTPFAVPVVAALLEDTANEIVVLGIACRADPLGAALKALVEAVHLRLFALGMLDPTGAVWRAIAAGIFDRRQFKPYRADRTYRDAFRPDFGDITDLGAQTQLYLDPRMREHVARVLSPPATVPLASLPTVAGNEPGAARAAYLARLRARGFAPVSVDLTTSDIRSVGLHVVRVIVPGLYPNGPAAYPFLGGQRLYSEPAELGWVPAPLVEADIVRAPAPYS